MVNHNNYMNFFEKIIDKSNHSPFGNPIPILAFFNKNNYVLTTVFLRPGLALFFWDARLTRFNFAEGYNFFVALLPRGL